MSSQEISQAGVTWAHGTTGASLMLLPHTEFTLHSTGALLAKRIAPLCGELMGGGLSLRGFSYHYVSGAGPHLFSTVVDYANREYPVEMPDDTLRLSHVIRRVQKMNLSNPRIDEITELAISVLRARQISESHYQQKSAEKIQSVIPIVTDALDRKRSMIDRVHSLASTDISNATCASLVQIMKDVFGASVLHDVVHWDAQKAQEQIRTIVAKHIAPKTSLDTVQECFDDTITPRSIHAFWALLITKFRKPHLFDKEFRPMFDLLHRGVVRNLDMVRGIFNGAVSADPAPVHLSAEEASAVGELNRVPVILASTLNLQDHVDQTNSLDGFIQFNSEACEEIPLLGPLKLGREINVVMTDPAHVPDIRAFLLRHQIHGVDLFSFTTTQKQRYKQLRMGHGIICLPYVEKITKLQKEILEEPSQTEEAHAPEASSASPVVPEPSEGLDASKASEVMTLPKGHHRRRLHVWNRWISVHLRHRRYLSRA